MPTFLFWNVNRKSLDHLVAAAATELDVDLLLLAESPANPVPLLQILNAENLQYFLAPSNCRKIRMYCRFDPSFLRPMEESDRFTICRLRLPARQEILVSAAHMPSKRDFNEMGQALEISRLAQSIISIEKIVGHTRTLLMGDINANPFDSGMISAGALHAVASRETAKRLHRTVQDREYPFFYNPMWGRFGDDREGEPPGTYYYEKAEHSVYFWNIFDQALMRPDLADSFRRDDLRIITRIGKTELLKDNGRPNETIASDHLPILLRIDF